MKISPAARELLERGICTGNRAASIATATPNATSTQVRRGLAARLCVQYTTKTLPSSTPAYQYTADLRL